MLAQLSLRDRARDESGQIIAFAAIAMVALLAMCAFVIDVGYAYFTHRALQSSTDAAALAGAHGLPNSGTAIALAHQYSGSPAGKNEHHSVSDVETQVGVECRQGAPCQPMNAVVVTETARIRTFFAPVVGIDDFTVSTRAVALLRHGPVPYAIFSYDSDCAFGFKYNGNVMEVDGAIHANGSFEVNGQNVTAGYGSSGGPNACEPVTNGDHIDFGGDDEPAFDPSLRAWPRYFTTGDFSCTYTAEEFKFNDNNETIPPGVYCASKLFEANANHQTGNITVLAPEIKIDGNNQQFTPYANDVLFFATGDKDMVLNGNSYDWTGIIFHPGGRIKINGNADSILTGLIEAREVEVNGNAFRMTGTGPEAVGMDIDLVE